MKRSFRACAVLLLAGLLTVMAASLHAEMAQKGDMPPAGAGEIISFDTMVGLPADLAGSATIIRDVSPAGAPWTIAAVDGVVTEDGVVSITVEGLVLTETGVNPSPQFAAIVSCQTSEGVFENAMTDLFPADTAGNAVIEDQVELPNPCPDPAVFVTNPQGRWFAMTDQTVEAAP